MKPLHLKRLPAALRRRLEAAGKKLPKDPPPGRSRGPVARAMDHALRQELRRRHKLPESPVADPIDLAVSIPEDLLEEVRAQLRAGESLSSFARRAADRL